MRNLILDRAGYCFGSPLGRTLFDNGDCSGTDVTLAREQARQVKAIQAMEQENGCKVNTNGRRLDMSASFMATLRRLRDLPLPSGGGTACLSWRGAKVPVFDGYTPGSKQIGEIRAGDWLGFSDQPEGNWVAVTVSGSGPGGRGITGWFDHTKHDTQKNCTDWAG